MKTTWTNLYPQNLVDKVTELGFHFVSHVELLRIYSVVGIRRERRYNIQLDKDTLKVIGVWLLKYRYNHNGNKISGVDRVLVK